MLGITEELKDQIFLKSSNLAYLIFIDFIFEYFDIKYSWYLDDNDLYLLKNLLKNIPKSKLEIYKKLYKKSVINYKLSYPRRNLSNCVILSGAQKIHDIFIELMKKK